MTLRAISQPTNAPLALDVERARDMLATYTSVDMVKEFRDKAKALDHYTRSRKAGREAEIAAAEIVARAERRLGELLRETEKATGAKGIGKSAVQAEDRTPRLSDLGVTKNESSRFQKLAAVPEAKFEKQVSALKESDKRPTTNAVLAATRPPVEAPKRRREEPVEVPVPEVEEQPTEWSESAAIADLIEAVGCVYDAWPSDQSAERFVKRLRMLADKYERWENEET